VSSPGAASGSGRIAVLFGQTGLNGWSLNTPSLTPTGDPGGALGPAARAGDVNGDGFDDLLVAAPHGGSSARGKVYLLDGREDWAQSFIDVSTYNDGTFYGESDGDLFGSTLAAGLVDGDGYVDVLIGSSTHGNNQGKVYLFRGSSGGWDIRHASASDAVWVGSYGGQAVGASLVLSDLNDDDQEDLVIGAPGDASGGTQAGTVFVYYWN
jgi:hypothetical protein